MSGQKLKVLVLSKNYPNNVTPISGVWVAGLVKHISKICETRVVAPTPYCPPLPGLPNYTRFRQVQREQQENGVKIYHPRFLIGPGYSFYNFEAETCYWSVRRQIDRLRREFPFDLIHANFGYPDGVIAARLARRYQVPFLITEHASWIPWMDNYRQVRRQAVKAAAESSFHIAVSRFTRDTIAHFTGETEKLRVIYNGVDTDLFTPPAAGQKPNPNQILFVGLMRPVKGVDILLKATRQLANQNPAIKLILVGGGGNNRNYNLHEQEMRRLAQELGLAGNVEFAGLKSPAEVAGYMRESCLLVLPSRTETFGAVLIEALACGTPVVATRCGGPEEFVTEKVGRLVPKEDPDALAAAIAGVMAKRGDYDSQVLRACVFKNFAWETIARQTVDLYEAAVNSHNQI